MQCNVMQCNAMQCNAMYVCMYVCMRQMAWALPGAAGDGFFIFPIECKLKKKLNADGNQSHCNTWAKPSRCMYIELYIYKFFVLF